MNKEHLDTHWISTKYSQDSVMLIFLLFKIVFNRTVTLKEDAEKFK